MLFLMGMYFLAGFGKSVLLIGGAVLLHEFAHAAAAGLSGMKVAEIQLFPFGGQAKIEDFTAMQPLKEVGVALAGPAISLLLAGLFSYVLPQEDSLLREEFVRVNWMLFLFNLLPVLPLDGGRVLRAILGIGLGYRRATQLTAGLGQVLGVLLLAWGFHAFLQGLGANQMLIGVVLFWTAYREQRFFSYSFLRFLLHHKNQLHEKSLLPVKTVVCMSHTEVRRILEDLQPQHYLLVTVVDEQQRIIGNCSEAQLIQVFMEHGTRACVRDGLF